MLSLVPAGRLGAAACASNHITANLFGLPSEAVSRAFYSVVEPDSGTIGAAFTIRVFGDDCTEPKIRIDYGTVSGTAQSGVDYAPTSGTAELILPVHADAMQQVTVPVNPDAEVEAVVESTDIVLSNPILARLIEPFTAPLLIIDPDGTTRVAFEGASYAQSETAPSVRLPLFRAGPATGSTSLMYSIGPTGQSPAAPGSDYTGTSPGIVSFGPGERVKTIDVSLVNDAAAELPETLAITLTGTEVVTPSTTMVTILDNEEGVAPMSKLHHPRHRWRYPYNDYRLREIHVFTKDDLGGSGVVAVELALRRKMVSGKCGWWNGKRFRGGDCTEKVWRRMKVYEPGYFYYARIKAIAPSVGTLIMNYTAYARAIDGAGNVESLLRQRRNRNTFEVKRRTGLR